MREPTFERLLLLARGFVLATGSHTVALLAGDLAQHIDPVRSTRRHRIFAFGHVWVVLAVLRNDTCGPKSPPGIALGR